jgi:hypothetical protein
MKYNFKNMIFFIALSCGVQMYPYAIVLRSTSVVPKIKVYVTVTQTDMVSYLQSVGLSAQTANNVLSLQSTVDAAMLQGWSIQGLGLLSALNGALGGAVAALQRELGGVVAYHEIAAGLHGRNGEWNWQSIISQLGNIPTLYVMVLDYRNNAYLWSGNIAINALLGLNTKQIPQTNNYQAYIDPAASAEYIPASGSQSQSTGKSSGVRQTFIQR